MRRASAASPAPGGMLHISRATRSLLKPSCMLWVDLTKSRKRPVEAAHSEVMSLGVILGTNGEPTQMMDSREQLHVDGQRQAFLGSPGRAKRDSDTDSSAHVQAFTAGCMSGGRGLACEELSCSALRGSVRCGAFSPLRRGGGGGKKTSAALAPLLTSANQAAARRPLSLLIKGGEQAAGHNKKRVNATPHEVVTHLNVAQARATTPAELNAFFLTGIKENVTSAAPVSLLFLTNRKMHRHKAAAVTRSQCACAYKHRAVRRTAPVSCIIQI